MLIDTHCHLNDKDAFPDPGSAVESALSVGVKVMVVIGLDTASSLIGQELAEAFEPVYFTAGWHPSYSTGYSAHGLKEVSELYEHPKCVAIGEIGLEGKYPEPPISDQMECLEQQIELAVKLGAPVVFHCREAYDELLAVLEARPPFPFVLHCFSGDHNHLERGIRLGAYFGIDGPVTFKNKDELIHLVSKMPANRVLLETDSPYMTPEPYRGQRNEPAHIPLINSAVAGCLGLNEESSALRTTQNALSFFRIPNPG